MFSWNIFNAWLDFMYNLFSWNLFKYTGFSFMHELFKWNIFINSRCNI